MLTGGKDRLYHLDFVRAISNTLNDLGVLNQTFNGIIYIEDSKYSLNSESLTALKYKLRAKYPGYNSMINELFKYAIIVAEN